MSREDLLGPAAPASVDEAPARPRGHPLLATIIGCGLILLSARPHPSLASGSEMIAELVGYIVAGIAIVWGIAWLVTVRRASVTWQIGSFVAVALASLLAALFSLGAGRASAQNDVSDAGREMKQAIAGGHDMAVGPNSGPILRMGAAMFNGVREDAASFKNDADAAGLAKLMALDGISPASPVLSHCERLDALAGQARTIGDRWNVHRAAAHAVGEEAVRADQMSPNDLRDFEEGVDKSAANYRRSWELNAKLATETAGLCRLLHGRSWHNGHGTVVFSSPSDVAAFNDQMERMRAIVAEQAELRRLAQTQWSGDQGKLGT